MFDEIMEMDADCIAPTYGRLPLGMIKGEGAHCWDMEGRECLDFTAGIGVNSLGFCHPEWVKAVQRQTEILSHASNLYYTYPDVKLAKSLCEKTGCSKVFFGNSGAEANEGALKAARKYSFDKYGGERYEILTLENSFHGRTLQTLSATGQDGFHRYFGPFCQGFAYTPANDLDRLSQAVTEKTCAILLETVQGEGGVVPLEPRFAAEVQRLCRERDLVLIVDEVQTGVGRTGTFLSGEQLGLSPDIVTLAKGLGGGLPIGAVLLFEKTAAVFAPGDHGSTFGGNPIVCAGANAVMEQMTEAFLREVGEKGAYLREKLLALPRVTAVDGLGLMLGVSFDGLSAKEILLACLEQKVLFLTAKSKLRLLPPLVITYEELDHGLAVLKSVLERMDH